MFEKKLKTLNDRKFEKELFVHSVGILEKIRSKDGSSDSQFELSDLMELTRKEFGEKFPWIDLDVQDPKQSAEVWQEFDFINETVLTSNSLLLPLKIDW